MSKYIDAEKLKKSIGNYMEGAHAALNPIDGDADYYKGKIDACKDIQEFITSLQEEQPEVEKYDCPTIPIEESIEVISRMQYIDEELKPIAKFIMDYASWNLHKNEWNQPTIEVPLFRVLDALVQKGKPYCEA